MDKNEKTKLYVEVAEKIISLIEHGVLKAGDKVPSIRELSSQLGISANTVKESYWYLENRNYLEAVPQSGYYVCRINNSAAETAENNTEECLLNPANVSICRIYGAFCKEGYYSPDIELGVASLPEFLLPSAKLNRYFQEAQRHDHNEAYNYCMTPGYWPLREQISFHALKAGFILKPEEIIITSGCSEAVYLALMSVCRPGDTIAVESPIYFNFLKVCEKLNLKIIEIPNTPEKGLSLDTLEFALKNYEIRAVLAIPTFNNPEGNCMSESNKERLVSVVEKYDIPLIEDDIYGELYHSGKRPKPCKAFDGTGNVILCSSFSKTIAPGLRVGWIAPGKYFRQVDELKLLLNIGTSTIPQIALSRYLRDGGYERHLRKVREHVAKSIYEMRQAVLGCFPEGTEVTLPDGGFVIWIKLPEPVNSLKLYETLLKKKIIIAPGAHFSMTDNYMNYIRLNGSSWNSSISKLIKKIAEDVKAQVNESADGESSLRQMKSGV